MGSLKVGDKIIVTYATVILVENKVGIIVEVDDYSDRHVLALPYRIKLHPTDLQSFWVNGIPHSSLLEELF